MPQQRPVQQVRPMPREVVTFLIFLIFGTPNRNVFQNSHKTVILRACDFFDLFVFSA
jgi:hypothetical protein